MEGDVAAVRQNHIRCESDGSEVILSVPGSGDPGGHVEAARPSAIIIHLERTQRVHRTHGLIEVSIPTARIQGQLPGVPRPTFDAIIEGEGSAARFYGEVVCQGQGRAQVEGDRVAAGANRAAGRDRRGELDRLAERNAMSKSAARQFAIGGHGHGRIHRSGLIFSARRHHDAQVHHRKSSGAAGRLQGVSHRQIDVPRTRPGRAQNVRSAVRPHEDISVEADGGGLEVCFQRHRLARSHAQDQIAGDDDIIFHGGRSRAEAQIQVAQGGGQDRPGGGRGVVAQGDIKHLPRVRAGDGDEAVQLIGEPAQQHIPLGSGEGGIDGKAAGARHGQDITLGDMAGGSDAEVSGGVDGPELDTVIKS